MLSRIVSVMCLTLLPAIAAAQAPAKVGVLLLAHGGKPEWNERVNAVAKTVDVSTPTEVAFGMASRATHPARGRSTDGARRHARSSRCRCSCPRTAR